MKSKEHEQALKLFNERKYEEAAPIFKKLNLLYEYGYCEFAQGHMNKAKQIWDDSKLDSPAIQWGKCFVNIVNSIMPIRISYLQVRNFFERDLEVLLWNKQLDYVEKFLAAENLILKANNEIYKYCGRVIMNYGYYTTGYGFLRKAEQICPNDPELKILKAKYFLHKFNRPAAIFELREILEFNPDYYPAKAMLLCAYEELEIGLRENVDHRNIDELDRLDNEKAKK